MSKVWKASRQIQESAILSAETGRHREHFPSCTVPCTLSGSSCSCAFYMSASSAVMVYMGSMLFYGIFSIINPCTREIVRDCVDENDQTTAIGIADAAQNNISTMISMLYSGFISERFGVNTLLSVCMVMAVATAALCMMLAARSASLSHRGRKKRSRQAA